MLCREVRPGPYLIVGGRARVGAGTVAGVNGAIPSTDRGGRTCVTPILRLRLNEERAP